MSNGSKVLIYLSLYLSASISRIVDSNPQGLISSKIKWVKIKFQYFLKLFRGKTKNLIFHKTEKKYFGRKCHLVRIAYARGIELNNF